MWFKFKYTVSVLDRDTPTQPRQARHGTARHGFFPGPVKFWPVLALSRRNSNAAETIVFLHRFVQVLVDYFTTLEEESIRDNYVIIYELMDEMIDFGVPQTTESKTLQEFITQESHQLIKAQVQPQPPSHLTTVVSWRPEGIRYRKNEVFLDVIESVNMLVNATGDVVRSEILGVIKMRCYLSGMPELRLGLNDKGLLRVEKKDGNPVPRSKAVEMEDANFHQCVRLSRFENDRTFIPPDGDFELMSYRLSKVVKPLIWVEAEIEHHGESRVVYMVKVIAQFKRKSTASNAATGTVQYAPDRNGFIWKIRQLAGGKEFLMRAQFGLPSVKNEQDPSRRAPITVKYDIPSFTVSGVQVRYLKVVEKSGYQALPWVRYITQNGDDYRFNPFSLSKDSGIYFEYSPVSGLHMRKAVRQLGKVLEYRVMHRISVWGYIRERHIG
ncbi:Mu homology domain-containing protein [Mycena alexandri]|uniref:Mu homology domain-containing protein n=1 Tax=Mycena alexandri TaxID=1745969 RepID=A0AAD6SCF0_9AGAR|nr:Mu homology domain-containing protein [Mycena alexandri]